MTDTVAVIFAPPTIAHVPRVPSAATAGRAVRATGVVRVDLEGVQIRLGGVSVRDKTLTCTSGFHVQLPRRVPFGFHGSWVAD